MILELNALQSFLATLSLVAIVAIVIFFFRNSIRRPTRTQRILPDHPWTRFRPISLQIGFVVALATSVIAFSFSRFAKTPSFDSCVFLALDEIEVKEIPRTAQKKKTPPKPIPTKIEVVPSDISLEPVVFQNPEPNEPNTEAAPAKPAPKVIAPPPRPKEPESDSLHLIVEVPPMFPGCEQISDREERKKCADETLLNFIQRQLNYPASARELGIEGLVAIRFVVEKDGSVTAIQVIRDPGGGLGAEAVRVVQSMPKWNPGIQGGRPVRVQFTLPVRFKLQ